MFDTHVHPTRIAIVGVGQVGATFAYTLLTSGIVAEVVLVDVNRARTEGEAMDLNHAVPFFTPTRIWAGDYSDCVGAAVTMIAAGVAQKPGEDRLALLQRNIDILRQVVPQVVRYNPEGILLIATNPVDPLAYAAWKLSGLPAQRVIGSGTILDTSRFRYLLSQHYGVDPRSVHAWIIGEHGDSEVPVWSLANIAGMRLAAFAQAQGLDYDRAAMDDIFQQTRGAAYEIIARKGATYYAVAAGLQRIVEAIVRDQSTVLSVSNLISGYYGLEDVYLSLPAVIDRGGIERVLRLELDEQEVTGLQRSAEVLQKTVAQLHFGAERAAYIGPDETMVEG